MKRRRFMAGLGAVSVGAAVTVGTGAMSQITGDRDAELRIASDQGSYLEFDDRSALAEYDFNTGEIRIDLTELDDFASGDGFNQNSVTEVTDPDSNSEQIFQIRNQADRSLEIAATTVGDIEDVQKPNEPGDLDLGATDDDDIRIELFDVDDPDREAIDQDNPRIIHPGGSGIPVGLRIIVPGEADLGETTITVVIQATEP